MLEFFLLKNISSSSKDFSLLAARPLRRFCGRVPLHGTVHKNEKSRGISPLLNSDFRLWKKIADYLCKFTALLRQK